MKIILKAFGGKLWSKPMDVPDNTTPDFYMPMPVDTLVYVDTNNTYVPDMPVMKRAKFQKTNMIYGTKDFTNDKNIIDESVHEYILVDIG